MASAGGSGAPPTRTGCVAVSAGTVDVMVECTAHDWEPWKHRDADAEAGAEECRQCHQVKIVCPHCDRDWVGIQMRASVDGPLLCADYWQREITRRIDAIERRLG